MDVHLDYDLPKKAGLLAGQIMKHCCETMDKYLRMHKPCIFKVGYTHCPSFRWNNPKFGYKYDCDKWEKMVVIYCASEAISPAFVEGALIQRHKGHLVPCQI